VLYPRIARLFADDQRAAAYLTVVGASATAAVTAAGVLFCAVLAKPLTTLVLGDKYAASALVLQLLCLATLFGNLAYFLGLQVLVPFGEERKRSMVMLCAGCLNVVLAIVLAQRFGAVGAAAAFAIAEGVILAAYIHSILHTARMKAHFTQLVRG
jgi:PST family polysaccharide transporter